MATLLYAGLSNAFAATVLALVVAAVARAVRRPALVHGLWLLVLLKLLTPPLWTVPVPWRTMPDEAARLTPPVEASARSAPLDISSSPASEVDPAPPDPPELPARTVSEPRSLGPARLPRSEARVDLSWEVVIGSAWLTGSVLWLVLAGLRFWLLRRLLRRAWLAPPAVQVHAGRLGGLAGLGRCPGVWFVAAPVSPMLWALAGAPRLLLPAGLWERLTAAQQDTLLLHELAHLRRRDHWVRWLELAVLALYWWHPVAWWVRCQLQEAEEQCCDAWVVALLPAAAEAYAEALVETLGFLSQARPALPLGASGAGHVYLLKRRLVMILEGRTPRALSRACLWAVLVLGMVLLSMMPGWAQRPAPADNVDPDEAAPPAAKSEDYERGADVEKARGAVRRLEAELYDLQADVRAVSDRLRRARARVARLEGRAEPGREFGVETKPGPTNWKKDASGARFEKRAADPVPYMPPGRNYKTEKDLAGMDAKDATLKLPTHLDKAAAPRGRATAKDLYERGALSAGQRDNYEQRLRQLEDKLNQLLEEMKSLREQRFRRPADARPKTESDLQKH